MRHFSDLYMRGAEGALVSLFAWGWHGVDLFFALSGFLIGGQIIEDCRAGSFRFREFFIKRTFRIIPPYFFAIAVFVAYFSWVNGFLILENSEVFKDFVTHALYMQDYIQSSRMMYNGIYWSLAVEEKFYIVLPLVMFLLYFVLKAEKKRYILFTLGALAALGMGLRFASYAPTKDFWSEYLAPFHVRFDNLLMGVIAAFVYFRERLLRVCKLALVLTAAVCLSLSYMYGDLTTGYFNVCWQFTLTGVGFSALILWLVSVDAGRFLPFKKLLAAVSKYSYTIYLYHLLLLGLTNKWLKALISGLDGGVAVSVLVFIVYFAFVTMISMGIYEIVDRPFMKLRWRILGEKDILANSYNNIMNLSPPRSPSPGERE